MKAAIGQVLLTGSPNVVCGAAVALTPNVVVTCAHVAEIALARAGVHPSPIEGAPIYLRFPFSEAPEARRGRVVRVFPRTEGLGGDLAFVHVEDPPALTVPSWGESSEREIKALGFPAPRGGVNASQWAYGVTGDAHPNGWVQIESNTGHGYWVQRGFSGTPVWTMDGWVACGLVAAVDTQPGVRIGFVIPSRIIIKSLAESHSDEDARRLSASFERDRLADLQELRRKQLGRFSLALTPGSIRTLADRLEPGEVCHYLAAGPVNGVIGTQFFEGLVAATDRRVIFTLKLPALPAVVKSFRFADIVRIEEGVGGIRIDTRLGKRLSVLDDSYAEPMRQLREYAAARLQALREA